MLPMMMIPLLALSSVVPHQDEKAQKPTTKAQVENQDPASKPAKRQSAEAILAALLAKEGVRIDKKKGVVHAEGKIVVTRDFLEYVAIGTNGKKHEALVMLRCRGSSLNAALLALGLKPGKNVDYEEIVPRPTREEYEAGAPLNRVFPPKGPRLWISVSWHDDDEKLVKKRVEDLIIDITTEKPVEGAKWIFTKALLAPIEKGGEPVFIADYDGNYISTYYCKPDTHFVTILHERGPQDGNWYANTAALPPPGTACTLTLSTKPLLPGDSPADEQDQPPAQRKSPKKTAEVDKDGRDGESRESKD